MRTKTYSNDTSNDLDSVGFDTSTFDKISVLAIHDYFSRDNFEYMFGWGEGDEIDFGSYIRAALDECTANGSLI